MGAGNEKVRMLAAFDSLPMLDLVCNMIENTDLPKETILERAG
jgi:hypothetical protein